MIYQARVESVRDELQWRLRAGKFAHDKSGCKMIEIAPCDFLANEERVFGEVNREYVQRELEWYLSMSLNVHDIPGGAPEIWKQVAGRDGRISSNYGWTAFHPDNHDQYRNALAELRKNPESRRACVIVQRPSIWKEYDLEGRSDFMCTWGHTFRIRDGKLDLITVMRSNDAIFGYKNDRAWSEYLQKMMAAELSIPPGDVYWHADSFHVYERHFYLVDNYSRGGGLSTTKRAYREAYPDSPWLAAMGE